MNYTRIPLSKSEISNQIFDFLGPVDTQTSALTRGIIYRKIPSTPPTPIQLRAKETFWALENWWKQIIEYHEFGPMVFDLGLHFEDRAEPGYFNSMKKACEFAMAHICKLPTPAFYKELHILACSHFKGEETNTLMDAKNAGRFDQVTFCECTYFSFVPDFSEERELLLKKMSEIYLIGLNYIPRKKETSVAPFVKLGFIDIASFRLAAKHAKDVLQKFNAQVAQRVKQVNAEIKHRSAELGLPPLAVITQIENVYPWSIRVEYKCECPEELVSQLFKNYAVHIQKAKSDDEKIVAIAYLIQLLEWAHPFWDGQGRVDNILREKLLCEVGLNPSILKFPYASTLTTLGEWARYIKKGMAKWKEEFANQRLSGTDK